MLISKDLNAAMNEEIGREILASHQYLQIAAYFDSETLHTTAKMFYKQAEEEHAHALKFMKYILDAGGEVAIPIVPAPKAKFLSAEDAIETALKWEMDVTRFIFGLMDIAVKEKDYIAQQFLNWYHNEQLEEVSTMDNLLRIVRRAGEKNLLMLEAYITHKD